ncbi:MAG: ABC transporter permease, partial [Lachnospiraceae bacterium]|nr:ABC transporter permease [Lachnospiraceae bacterium]
YTHIAAESIRFDQASLYLQILINSALMVSVSFLALPVGLAARSSKAAIVASVVIVCFTQGQIGEFTLSGNLDFYILLIALAAVSVFLSLWRIEMRDVG